MKITSKIIVLLMSVLLPMGFAGCSDDDDMPNPSGEEAPEFVLGQRFLRTMKRWIKKIGRASCRERV